MQERRVEFFGEGHRFFDLRRWGKLDEYVRVMAGKANYTEPKNLYFPIPQIHFLPSQVYANGDRVSFVHISSVTDGIKVGDQVYEGHVLGLTGETGRPHLHLAKDKDGNLIDQLRECTYLVLILFLLFKIKIVELNF